MDPNLHQKMGVHHLNRVLGYYPFVAESGHATVHLTPEDWQVVADTLFHMSTPKEVIPDAIRAYRLNEEERVIEVETEDCLVRLDTF